MRGYRRNPRGIPNSSFKGWIALLQLFLCGTFAVSCQSKKTTFLTTDSIQLAPPNIQVDSMLFNQTAFLSLELSQDDAQIRYTLDGSKVDKNALVYKGPFQLSATTEVKVRAFHPKFSPSDSQTVVVRKLGRNISSAKISVFPEPHSNYPGDGVKTLIDGQKGGFNFRKGKFWLGFQEKQISAELKFSEDIAMGSVVVSVLHDHDSWIFAPKTITVASNGKPIGAISMDQVDQPQKKKLLFMEVPVQKGSYQQLTITITPLHEIPEWHPGKGTLPWVFIDEIMVE